MALTLHWHFLSLFAGYSNLGVAYHRILSVAVEDLQMSSPSWLHLRLEWCIIPIMGGALGLSHRPLRWHLLQPPRHVNRLRMILRLEMA